MYASGQSGTGMYKNTDAGSSPVPEQGNPVRYQNEMLGAGIPMPAASVSMPMPDIVVCECNKRNIFLIFENFGANK
jgi:hypothetical protein